MSLQRLTQSKHSWFRPAGIGLLVLGLVAALAVSASGRDGPAAAVRRGGTSIRSGIRSTGRTGIRSTNPAAVHRDIRSLHLQRQRTGATQRFGVRPQVSVRHGEGPDVRDRPGSYRGHVGQLYLQRRAADELRDRLRSGDVRSRPPSGGLIFRRHDGDRDFDRDHRDGDHRDRDHRDRDGYHDKIFRHGLEHRYPVYRRYVRPRTGSTIIVGPGIYYRTYDDYAYVYPQPQTYVEQPYVEPYPPAPVWPDLPDPVEGPLADHGAAVSDEGWALVRQGNATDALTYFSRLAQVYRGAGVPQIGSAVSLAMLGELSRGAWNMRRALRIDPAAVAYTPRDDGVRATLQRLVLVYRRREQNAVNAKDAAFMLAALHAMLDETGAAHEMVGLAIQVGDTSEGAEALKGFLDAAYPHRQPEPAK